MSTTLFIDVAMYAAAICCLRYAAAAAMMPPRRAYSLRLFFDFAAPLSPAAAEALMATLRRRHASIKMICRFSPLMPPRAYASAMPEVAAYFRRFRAFALIISLCCRFRAAPLMSLSRHHSHYAYADELSLSSATAAPPCFRHDFACAMPCFSSPLPTTHLTSPPPPLPPLVGRVYPVYLFHYASRHAAAAIRLCCRRCLMPAFRCLLYTRCRLLSAAIFHAALRHYAAI